jgi:hypothetical protein
LLIAMQDFGQRPQNHTLRVLVGVLRYSSLFI